QSREVLSKPRTLPGTASSARKQELLRTCRCELLSLARWDRQLQQQLLSDATRPSFPLPSAAVG
ncbi:unnamed protein product, partial [Ascophyllum nodosum]